MRCSPLCRKRGYSYTPQHECYSRRTRDIDVSFGIDTHSLRGRPTVDSDATDVSGSRMTGGGLGNPSEALYGRLAPVYDFVYGAALQPGRKRALVRLSAAPEERILEVGAGTGWALRLYPPAARVTAV